MSYKPLWDHEWTPKKTVPSQIQPTRFTHPTTKPQTWSYPLTTAEAAARKDVAARKKGKKLTDVQEFSIGMIVTAIILSILGIGNN